jgi:hypothetical protein
MSITNTKGMKFFGSYTDKNHATPKDKSLLKCGPCGAEIVQHLGVQDGWTAGVGPNGLMWVCNRDVCRQEAAKQGVVFQPPKR